MEHRAVTVIGLIISVSGIIATIYPETHTIGVMAALVGAVAAAVGKTLWPDKFRHLPGPSVAHVEKPEVKPEVSPTVEIKGEKPAITVNIPQIKKMFKGDK